MRPIPVSNSDEINSVYGNQKQISSPIPVSDPSEISSVYGDQQQPISPLQNIVNFIQKSYGNPQLAMLSSLAPGGEQGQPYASLGQTLSASGVGIGQGIQDMLRPNVATALPMGMSGLVPGIAQSMTKSAQDVMSPVTDFDINQAVGMDPTPGQRQVESGIRAITPFIMPAIKEFLPINRMTNFKDWFNRTPSNSIEPPTQAPPGAAPIPLQPSSPPIKTEPTTSFDTVAATLNKAAMDKTSDDLASDIRKNIPIDFKNDINFHTNNIGSVPENIALHHDAADELATMMYSSPINTYGDATASVLRPKVIPGRYEFGIPLKAVDQHGNPINPLDNWDQYTPAQKQILIANGNVRYIPESQTPPEDQMKEWLGNDDFLLAKKYGGNQFKSAISTGNISDLHDLGVKIGQAGASATHTGDSLSLFDLANRIKQEGVHSSLQEMDSINGTQVAPQYKAADNFFKTQVLPYRANPTLYSIATGNYPDASSSTALDAIQKGTRQVRNWGRDPETNRHLPVITGDHFLSQYIPSLKHLSQYEANQGLSNLSNGTSTASLEKLKSLLDDSVENQQLEIGHPIESYRNMINKALDLKQQATQSLSDRQMADAMKSRQEIESYRDEMDKYRDHVKAVNQQNKQATDAYKQQTKMEQQQYNQELSDYKQQIKQQEENLAYSPKEISKNLMKGALKAKFLTGTFFGHFL